MWWLLLACGVLGLCCGWPRTQYRYLERSENEYDNDVSCSYDS